MIHATKSIQLNNSSDANADLHHDQIMRKCIWCVFFPSAPRFNFTMSAMVMVFSPISATMHAADIALDTWAMSSGILVVPHSKASLSIVIWHIWHIVLVLIGLK